MQTKERIKVFIKIIKGKTVCICKSDNKRCSENCPLDIVERDKYEGWESCFRRDRYGN